MTNSIKMYYENGNIERESWYINDKLHRLDGSASVWYYKNGNIEREFWFINDNYHRFNGPAYIWYYENGNIEKEYWFVNGIKVPDISEWLKENNIFIPYTKEDQMAIMLRWI